MHDNDETRYEIYRGTNKGMEVKFCMYGRPYCMDEADRLELEVRDYRNNNEIVIAKSVTGDNYFTFYPEDTENLDIGFYVYNVKLYPEDSEEIYTAIEPSVFQIKASE